MEPKKFIVKKTASLFELLETMGQITPSGNSSGFAIAVDDLENVVGVISDSDLRRYLLKKQMLPLGVSDLVNDDFIYISEADYINNLSTSVYEAISVRGWKTKVPIRFLPVIENKKVVRVLDLIELDGIIENQKDLIYVIGLGYVGLTFALFMASQQKKIVGIEIDENKVENLLKKMSYVNEIGLQNLLEQTIGTFFNPTNTYEIINQRKFGVSATFVLCLPTPLNESNRPNEKYLLDAIIKLTDYIKSGDLLVLRSTVPIGFCRKAATIIEERTNLKIGIDFYLVFAPERTIEGNALSELASLPQIIGGVTKECQKKGSVFFQHFTSNTIIVDKIEEAELIKIASNAYRDYVFAFSNYLAIVAQEYALDINTLIKNANNGYARNNFPAPSPGVGGPCLTKDPYFMPIIDSHDKSPIYVARKFNEKMPERVVKFLQTQIGSQINSKEIAVLGLAFKGIPETNDLRNSTNIEIYNLLKTLKYYVTVFEPTLDLGMLPSIYQKINKPAIILVLNNHPKNIDKVLELLSTTEHSLIWLFDPWRLIPLNITHVTKSKVMYLTLSNSEYKI